MDHLTARLPDDGMFGVLKRIGELKKYCSYEF